MKDKHLDAAEEYHNAIVAYSKIIHNPEHEKFICDFNELDKIPSRMYLDDRIKSITTKEDIVKLISNISLEIPIIYEEDELWLDRYIKTVGYKQNYKARLRQEAIKHYLKTVGQVCDLFKYKSIRLLLKNEIKDRLLFCLDNRKDNVYKYLTTYILLHQKNDYAWINVVWKLVFPGLNRFEYINICKYIDSYSSLNESCERYQNCIEKMLKEVNDKIAQK